MKQSNLSQGEVSVHLNPNLELSEKDSMKSANLEESLIAFLIETDSGIRSNEYTDAIHKFFFNKFTRW